jgi:hypothetical protein
MARLPSFFLAVLLTIFPPIREWTGLLSREASSQARLTALHLRRKNGSGLRNFNRGLWPHHRRLLGA